MRRPEAAFHAVRPTGLVTCRSLFFRSDAILAAIVFLFRDQSLIAQDLISCELGFVVAWLPCIVHAGVILHKIMMNGGSLAFLEQWHEHDQQKDADA